MASKKSFAAWSEEKQTRENKTVNGKTFAQFTQEKRREAAAEDYNTTVVPRSAGYLDLTKDLSRSASEAPARARYGRGNIDLYDRPVYRNPDGSISTVDSFSANIDGSEVLLPQIGRDAQGNAVRWTEDQAIDNYLKTGENLGVFKTPEDATSYAEWLHDQQEQIYSKDPLMDLAKETVNGLGRATPEAPGDGGRGYNTVADLDPATATPGDYMAAIAREQNRYYAKAVTPDNSPLGVQRRETNRAFRTANAFMPLENQSPEAWDTYNKLYDEAVEEDRKLKEMGGRAARELPVTLPKSLAAGTLGAVRGLVNEAGYIAQGATKAQMDENAEMWRRMGREDYAQDMETAKDAQGGFQNWANFGQNYISSAAEAAAGYGKTGQALSSVAQGVGGMVPSIVSNLVVPGSGLPVMFFQASGNATEEAKAAGASDEAAAVYGTAVGAVEVLTEKMFGGIPGLGVGALDDAVENAIKRSVGNEAAQRALLFLIDALGEGVEEFTSEFGDYFLNKWLLKNDDRTIDEVGKDAMYSFLIGALTSIAMQAPVEVANMAKTSQGRKQLAQIVADQVDQQIEQPVAPQTETQIAEGPAAEPQTAQPITQALLRSIAADPEQLAQMGIDANGKTNSQIREEIRAKLLADRAAQEQAQRASALAQEMRSKPSELGWYGMPSDDPVAAPNWYNQQNVAETDEDGVPAAPAAPWYNTPQFDNYGNSEWYEGRAATQPIVEPLMQLAQEMATEQITAARDAELRAQEAAKAQAVMAAQNAQATQATIPAQQTAPAMQKPSARAAEPTTSARGTPAQAQNKPTVRAENPGLVRDEIAAKAKLTSRESRALDALGKVLGKKIQFVDMITASVTDEDGNVRHSGANAEIDGDTIRIALDSDDPFLVAAVHEVVHGIRDLDEESYQSLAKFVSRNMSEDNRKVAEWEEAHKGYSAEDIPEEIVCDAFGRMLGDEAKLQQFVQDDRNAAQKLFDALHDLLVKVQRALSGGGQKLTDNQRAVYSDLESRIETMLSLFEEALNNVSGVEGETDGVATRHSLKSTMATLNLHDEMRDGKRVWVDENGNVVTKITPKMVRSTGVGALIDIASQEWKDDNGNVIKPASITKKEADKQVAGATKLMNMILKAQDGELVWRFAGSAMFSAVKSNSDAQYGTTIDFSTVCRKTQEMMTAMSKTMVKLGRGLTKDEVIQLQKDILEENGTVPCPVCYVFSRWAGVGGILDNMLKWQNKYGHEYDDPARLNARMEELKAATKTKKDLRTFLKENDATYMDMTGEREELQAERKNLNAMRRKLAKAGNTDAVAEIDERLKVINNRVDQLGKDIKAMEDSGAPELAWLDRVRSQPTYWTQGNVPANILFNMDDAATFAEQYSLAWSYRTNRGPGAGKAILPYSDMRLGDMILGPKNGSASGNTTFKTVKDGFNSDQKRAFKNALKRTLAQNLIGGQRFQSTSDFRYDYGLDYLQVFWEAQALGSKMQTYTKVIEFAEIVAAIGGDCNLSVMPLEQGYDENGRLKFSAVTGIDIEAASKANAMYDNVQLILVGINDEHIRLALSDSTESGGNLISFVIPYHASGASINNFIRGLVQNLGESFNEEYYKDYTPIQNDSERKNATAVQKQRAEIRKKILTGYETVDGNRSAWTPSEEELQIIRGTGKDISTMSFEEMLNIERRALAGDKAAIKEYESWSAGVLWDMYQKMWVDRKAADTYGVRLSTKQAEHIMPHEYWFKDADRSHAYLNGFIFRSYCYSLGLTPRFTGIDSTGKHIGYGDFTDSPGYWKTLIDRPMYANDGTYREQQKINITELSPEMLTPEYGEKNWGGYRVAEPDEQIAEKASQRFVERAQGKKRYSLKSVKPVVPSSEKWNRGATYDEVKAAHPTLYELSSEEQDTRNPTQISGTVKTYRKIYDALQDEGFDGTILDASSGLGVGTQAGRDEYGFDVDDIEPFPDKSYTPKYTDYSKLNKQYDVVISNAVLNVLPQDLRDAMVVKIGELMAPGGRAFINVRGDDVKNAKSKIAIDEGGLEYFIADGASYQKGFKKAELKAYLEDTLGSGFTVDTQGGFGGVSVVVRKDGGPRYSRSGRDILDEYVEQYGEIKRGEKPARDFSMPKRTTDKTKVSMTARTVAEAGATPESFVPTIENLAANHEFDYTPYSDEAAIGNAAQIAARKGWSRALTDWSKEVSNGGVSKTNTAVGWALYNNAVNSGDTETALNVLNLIVKHQRNAAQAVQATRILKQLNPETQLYNAENIVADINEDLKKRLGKDTPEVEIDQDLAEQFLRAKKQDDRDKVMTRIFQNIGRQMPTTFLDRWTAWRYTAMLGNPRTIIRNISGNAGFAPVVFTKDAIATAIESAASAVTGGKIERTKGNIIGRSDLLKAAWDDYANMQEIAMGESKYSDRQSANKEIQDARKIFGNTKSKAWNKTGGRVLEGWRVLTGKAMDVTDVWFNKPQYVLAMAQYCAANGISAEQIRSGKGLEKARAYAVKEAQKATYRDTNDFSQMVSSLGKSWLRSDNAWKRGIATLGEGVLPFRKTPANILARGVEYSPIGLLKAISYDAVQVKKGNMSAADMIDDISAGLTGTGLLALGVYLAAQGLLRGRGRGDDKKKEFADLEGHQDYALELPDGTSITLDWLAPEALPVFIGANLWEAAADRKDGMKMKDVLTAVSNVSEPMLQMSMLQSLNDLLDGNTYGNEETSALMRKLSSAATSYLTQAFPTLLGQVERTNENKRMTTYTDKNRFLTSDMQYILGKISAKIPGWDFQQIPYIDAWGREELTGTFLERAGNNFLNPSFVSKISDDDLETELVRLYDVTGENVFPERANKYITTDGERKDLNAEEYLKYATAKGRTSYAVVGGLLNSSIYKGLPDDDKAACVKYAYDYASQTAKTVVGGSIPTSYKWVKEASEGVSKGIAPETYILAMNAVKSTQGIKDKNGNTITNSAGLAKMQAIYTISGLNDNQRRYLFECFDVGKTIIGYNKTLVNQKLAEMKKQ